jgi:hypothetical protein
MTTTMMMNHDETMSMTHGWMYCTGIEMQSMSRKELTSHAQAKTTRTHVRHTHKQMVRTSKRTAHVSVHAKHPHMRMMTPKCKRVLKITCEHGRYMSI